MTSEQRQQDSVLVEKLRSGDLKAFDSLYFKYSKRLFSFSLGLLHSREEAEGMVQEVFIKIWENKEKLRPDLSFSWYIFTIARNAILNQIHHNQYATKYKQINLLQAPESENETEERLFYKEVLEQVESAIEKLPAKRKEVFLLSRRDGLSYQEIADKLNLSIKTVEVQISQALKHLREQLKE